MSRVAQIAELMGKPGLYPREAESEFDKMTIPEVYSKWGRDGLELKTQAGAV